jgi:hypothetical protein
VATVEYGLSVLQGLFSVNPLEITEGGKLDAYQGDLSKLDEGAMDRQWRNHVVRTWNGIQQSMEDDAEETEVGMRLMTEQLSELDAIFVTHFSTSVRFFMTSSSSWTSLMPMYVEALGKYADEIAQQPAGTPWMKKFRQGLPEKIRFVMLNHKRLHFAPPLPLMTRSVVGVIADSLKEISLAIYEVSTIVSHSFILSDTRYMSGVHCKQVEYVRPASSGSM